MSQIKFNKTLLNVNHVSFSYAKRDLFTDLNFAIADNERVALVGPNGIGKTTLLNLIRGQIKPDSGQIICRGEINYVPQVDPQEINDAQSAGEKRLELIENTIWLPGSLLLLDEPTVYLDEANIQNLLYLLKNYDGAILVASHDLDFINQLCNKTIILQPHNVIYFPGNYDQYLSQKKLSEETVRNFNEKRIIEKKKLTEKINTLKAKSIDYSHFTKSKDSPGRLVSRGKDTVQKSLNARVKRAERELAAVPEAEQAYHHRIILPKFKKWPQKMRTYELKIQKLDSPKQKTLLKDTELVIHMGETIGLVGPNGSGKTTLLKYLKRYFNQKMLLPKATYIGLKAEKNNDAVTVENFFKKTILGKTDVKRLLVKMDMFVNLDTLLKYLSGGELAKLTLLKQLYLNEETILLLDEPTNYLDPESVTALAKMLKESHLTCVIASHNHHFLAKFCQREYEIKKRKLIEEVKE